MNHRSRKAEKQKKNTEKIESFLQSVVETITRHEKDLNLVMAHCFRRDMSRHYRGNK